MRTPEIAGSFSLMSADFRFAVVISNLWGSQFLSLIVVEAKFKSREIAGNDFLPPVGAPKRPGCFDQGAVLKKSSRESWCP